VAKQLSAENALGQLSSAYNLFVDEKRRTGRRLRLTTTDFAMAREGYRLST
jgi:hypothetical protein